MVVPRVWAGRLGGTSPSALTHVFEPRQRLPYRGVTFLIWQHLPNLARVSPTQAPPRRQRLSSMVRIPLGTPLVPPLLLYDSFHDSGSNSMARAVVTCVAHSPHGPAPSAKCTPRPSRGARLGMSSVMLGGATELHQTKSTSCSTSAKPSYLYHAAHTLN